MAQGGWEAVGPEGGFAWDLAISPSYASDATVFAGVTGGVLRSLDGGDTWHRADRGLDNEFVPAIALSPGFEADGTLFAGTSGGGVYVSTDRADSWRQAGRGLGNANVEALAISPSFATDGTLLAGTFSTGLYRSVDGGDSWRPVNRGLTNSSVLAIAFRRASGQTRLPLSVSEAAASTSRSVGGVSLPRRWYLPYRRWGRHLGAGKLVGHEAVGASPGGLAGLRRGPNGFRRNRRRRPTAFHRRRRHLASGGRPIGRRQRTRHMVCPTATRWIGRSWLGCLEASSAPQMAVNRGARPQGDASTFTTR